MSGRLRADIWVADYIRRCSVEGASCMLRKRGAAEAGAIFVKLDCLDGRAALFAPAPQSLADDSGERLFVRAHKEEWIDPLAVEERMAKEIRFDSDLWLLEVEDRQGRHFLPLGGA